MLLYEGPREEVHRAIGDSQKIGFEEEAGPLVPVF